MLAIRLRVRPCSDRCVGSSDDRSTRRAPSPVSTLIWRGTWRASSPRGPLTRTVLSATSIVTRFGSYGIGILPIRDTFEASVLPDVGQDFAAHFEAARPCTTHDALRRRQDGGAQAAEDAWNGRGARIHAQAGLADLFQTHQHRVTPAAAWSVTQVDAQHLLDALATFFERIDVALVTKYLGNRQLDTRERHLAAGVTCL